MSDEFDGIFDDLTIADFLNAGTAVEELEVQLERGVAGFNRFVDEQLRAVRTVYVASNGYLKPFIILASPTTQRTFVPLDEQETLGEFVARVHEEAVRMEALWSFVVKDTLVGTKDWDSDSRDIDVNDETEIQKAIEDGILTKGIVWYAERREGDERHHRHGTMADQDGRLGATSEGSPEQPIPLFASILGLA